MKPERANWGLAHCLGESKGQEGESELSTDAPIIFTPFSMRRQQNTFLWIG